MRNKAIVTAIFLMVVVGFGLVGKLVFGLPLVAAIPIAVGAILLNGLVAILEDDLPGGFNNPDGATTPKYVGKLRWVLRGFVAFLVVVSIVLWVALH